MGDFDGIGNVYLVVFSVCLMFNTINERQKCFRYHTFETMFIINPFSANPIK